MKHYARLATTKCDLEPTGIRIAKKLEKAWRMLRRGSTDVIDMVKFFKEIVRYGENID